MHPSHVYFFPHSCQDLLYTSTNRSNAFYSETQNGINNQQQQAINHARRPAPNHRSPLALLRADENTIEQRKQNVRRFGAGWLRPPGVAKTLQSKLEEEQERLEQLEMQRRDAELRAQELAAQQATMGGLDGEAGMEEDQEERDLDAEVPEAEDLGGESDEEAPVADVTFNDESFLEGSVDGDGQAVLEMEDAELDGRLQDERDLGMEGDLDDDVPEAGSYQHTDTEVEDESSEVEVDEDDVPTRIMRGFIRSDGRARRSLQSEDGEVVGSSSFVESSPAMTRRPGRGNAFRNSTAGRRRQVS